MDTYPSLADWSGRDADVSASADVSADVSAEVEGTGRLPSFTGMVPSGGHGDGQTTDTEEWYQLQQQSTLASLNEGSGGGSASGNWLRDDGSATSIARPHLQQQHLQQQSGVAEGCSGAGDVSPHLQAAALVADWAAGMREAAQAAAREGAGASGRGGDGSAELWGDIFGRTWPQSAATVGPDGRWGLSSVVGPEAAEGARVRRPPSAGTGNVGNGRNDGNSRPGGRGGSPGGGWGAGPRKAPGVPLRRGLYYEQVAASLQKKLPQHLAGSAIGGGALPRRPATARPATADRGWWSRPQQQQVAPRGSSARHGSSRTPLRTPDGGGDVGGGGGYGIFSPAAAALPPPPPPGGSPLTHRINSVGGDLSRLDLNADEEQELVDALAALVEDEADAQTVLTAVLRPGSLFPVGAAAPLLPPGRRASAKKMAALGGAG